MAAQYEIEYEDKDTIIYIVKDHDHTFGNMLQIELLQDPDVIYAAYIVPHPLEKLFKLKITVNENGRGGSSVPTAKNALEKARKSIKEKLTRIKRTIEEL